MKVRSIALIFVLLIFCAVNIYANQIVVAHFPVKKDKYMEFLNGVKENSGIKLIEIGKNIKNIVKIDSVIVFNKEQFNAAIGKFKYVFSAFYVPETISSECGLIGIFKEDGGYQKVFDTISKKFPKVDKVGIVLHDNKLIREIANLMIYHPLIKIYEVKNKGEIFYKFKKAVDSNDMILILPDDYIVNYLTFQKIIKIILNKGLIFGGYGKFLLKYKANFAFEYDYFESGKEVGEYLLNRGERRFRVFLPVLRFFYR